MRPLNRNIKEILVKKQKGLTLVELLVAITIVSIIALAAMPMLSTSIESHHQGMARSRLYQEGLVAMERMTSMSRQSTFILIPNDHDANRDILAVSGTVNEDNDHYFNDPLFPRIDEDPKKQMTDDETAGIIGFDDDGDGATDEGDRNDDDEDGLVDEDPMDGVDNDGDGNIDEDTGDDANVAGMDDDADGSIDEGDVKDDDEDGLVNEDHLNPLIYAVDSATNTLTETSTHDGTTFVLATHVSDLRINYSFPPAMLRISLDLEGNDGQVIHFDEYVYCRNIYQKTGKRVR